MDNDQCILPLINIVFLLLIFFMLAGKLIADGPFEVTLPVSKQAANQDIAENIVLIGKDGQLALNNVIMDETTFKVALAAVAGNGKNIGAHFRGRADTQLDATALIIILEWMRDAGISKIHLVTLNNPP